MRGGDHKTGKLFSYVDLEMCGFGVIIRCERSGTIVSEALSVLEGEFAKLY